MCLLSAAAAALAQKGSTELITSAEGESCEQKREMDYRPAVMKQDEAHQSIYA